MPTSEVVRSPRGTSPEHAQDVQEGDASSLALLPPSALEDPNACFLEWTPYLNNRNKGLYHQLEISLNSRATHGGYPRTLLDPRDADEREEFSPIKTYIVYVLPSLHISIRLHFGLFANCEEPQEARRVFYYGQGVEQGTHSTAGDVNACSP